MELRGHSAQYFFEGQRHMLVVVLMEGAGLKQEEEEGEPVQVQVQEELAHIQSLEEKASSFLKYQMYRDEALS
jgi:hypothetical protein